MSKKRLSLEISSPFIISDTINIKRSMRPLVFGLDILAAVTIIGLPVLPIDFANGNIWRIKKSSKRIDLEFDFSESFEEYKSFLSLKGNPNFTNTQKFLKEYPGSKYVDSVELIILDLEEKEELRKLQLEKEEELRKLELKKKEKALEEIANQSRLLNILTAALKFKFEVHSEMKFNSLLDAFIFKKNENDSIYYCFGDPNYVSMNIYDELAENDKDFYYEFAGGGKSSRVLDEWMNEINYRIDELCQLIKENNLQSELSSILEKLTEKELATLMMFQNEMFWSEVQFVSGHDYHRSRKEQMKNYVHNISRLKYKNYVDNNKNLVYFRNTFKSEIWNNYFNNLKSQLSDILKEENNFRYLKKLRYGYKEKVKYCYESVEPYSSRSGNGKFKRNESFYSFNFLYNILNEYLLLRESEEINYINSKSINAYLNSSESIFDFNQDYWNWESIFNASSQRQKNKHRKNGAQQRLLSWNDIGDIYELRDSSSLGGYNYALWNNSVFYIKGCQKEGFYQLKYPENKKNQFDYQWDYFVPIQVVDRNDYKLWIEKPIFLFQNDTIRFCLSTNKNDDDKIVQEIIFKGMKDNLNYIYPSGRKDQSAQENYNKISNARRDGKISAAEEAMLLNRVQDNSNYNPGTPDFYKVNYQFNFVPKKAALGSLSEKYFKYFIKHNNGDILFNFKGYNRNFIETNLIYSLYYDEDHDDSDNYITLDFIK